MVNFRRLHSGQVWKQQRQEHHGREERRKEKKTVLLLGRRQASLCWAYSSTLMQNTCMCTHTRTQSRFALKQAPITDSPKTYFFVWASCRDTLISGKETKQWKVRKQQQYSHLKGVYFESGTASLSVTELIKSKGHHLQTRHPPKGEHLILYAAEEASQHPKNTALLEERCSTSLKGSMKN